MARPLKDDDEATLSKIMSGGIFDSLRRQIIEKLHKDPELQRFVDERVRNSDKLHRAAYDGADDRQLFEDLRKDDVLKQEAMELMLSKVSQATYDQRSPVCEAISAYVHETLCEVYEEREHGRQPAAPPLGRQQMQR